MILLVGIMRCPIRVTPTSTPVCSGSRVLSILKKKELANGKPRVLIRDGFGTHESLEILEYCFDNNIILCRIPSHTSHKLQPCDVSVFSSLKTAFREQAERLERGCVGTIGKEHFTCLYSPARTKAFTARNLRAGWSEAGL